MLCDPIPHFAAPGKPLVYGSVCSGIEAATQAWHPLGWRPAFFSEIDPFPRAVLAHHHPAVPLHGDFTTIERHQYDPIQLLVGGTPCQSFSVAGLRKGLADARGNLTLEFVRLAERLQPRWLVWENVPGVLSQDGGRAFGSFLGGLAELGYGFAYRVLDAQYFGLAQRRQRVFLVGHLGDWRPAAAVLFEPESLRRDTTPRREAGAGAAVCPTLRAGGNRTGGHRPPGTDVDTCESLVATALTARYAKGPDSDCTDTLVAHTLRGEGFDASEDGTGRGTPLVPTAIPLQEVGKRTGVSTDDPRAGLGVGQGGDPMFTLQAGAQHGVGTGMAVRRLTPRECERLQGFPDDFHLGAVPGQARRRRQQVQGPREQHGRAVHGLDRGPHPGG